MLMIGDGKCCMILQWSTTLEKRFLKATYKLVFHFLQSTYCLHHSPSNATTNLTIVHSIFSLIIRASENVLLCFCLIYFMFSNRVVHYPSKQACRNKNKITLNYVSWGTSLVMPFLPTLHWNHQHLVGDICTATSICSGFIWLR